MEVSNTLAYYDLATITTIKRLIVQAVEVVLATLHFLNLRMGLIS
jgi:hypothetical protein